MRPLRYRRGIGTSRPSSEDSRWRGPGVRAWPPGGGITVAGQRRNLTGFAGHSAVPGSGPGTAVAYRSRRDARQRSGHLRTTGAGVSLPDRHSTHRDNGVGPSRYGMEGPWYGPEWPPVPPRSLRRPLLRACNGRSAAREALTLTNCAQRVTRRAMAADNGLGAAAWVPPSSRRSARLGGSPDSLLSALRPTGFTRPAHAAPAVHLLGADR